MSAQLHGDRDLAAVAEALELGMASAEGAWESVAQRPQPHAVAGPEADILLGLLGGLRTLLGATDDQPVRARLWPPLPKPTVLAQEFSDSSCDSHRPRRRLRWRARSTRAQRSRRLRPRPRLSRPWLQRLRRRAVRFSTARGKGAMYRRGR